MSVSDYETFSFTGFPWKKTKGLSNSIDIVESEFLSCTGRESDTGSLGCSTSSAVNSLYTCAMDDKIVSKILVEDQSYTPGLVQSLNVTKESLALRIWIIDNSGSMQNSDGNKLVVRSKDDYPHKVKMVSCKRWEELKSTVNYHIQLAETIHAPTSFRFLNNPVDDDYNKLPERFDVAMHCLSDDSEIHRRNSCNSFFSCNHDKKSNMNDDNSHDSNSSEDNTEANDHDSCHLHGEKWNFSTTNALAVMGRVRPSGTTPLTKHILQIHQELSEGDIIDFLKRNNQSVAIVIATDGLPTDKEGYSYAAQQRMFVDALKQLQGLGPVRVIIRLCTDEIRVVSFYNQLDSIAGLSVEVLQDFVGQAKDVHEYNPWLNYTLPLHRLREMGYHDQILDTLNKRTLTKNELCDFFMLLFGKVDSISDTASSKNFNSSDTDEEKEENCRKFSGNELLNPSKDWYGFMKCLTKASKGEALHWHPIKQRPKSWISINKINEIYGSSKIDYYYIKASLLLGKAC